MTHTYVERGRERRADPIMATLIDVAISYRENLGGRVAAAFLRETGVPAALAQRVLDGLAARRGAPRRRTLLAHHDQARDLA